MWLFIPVHTLYLFVEPDSSQILVEVMAQADLPVLDGRPSGGFGTSLQLPSSVTLTPPTHCVKPQASRHRTLRDVKADLAPLVDHPDAIILVGLVDIAV